MTRKSVLFGFVVTLLFLGILLLPLKPITGNLSGDIRKVFVLVIKSILLGSILYFILKKYKLFRVGGLNTHYPNKYWMLFLPLLFPGVWAYNNFSLTCSQTTILLSILFTVTQGIWEEFVFRGVIQGSLIKFSPKASYNKIFLFTNFLFAFGHLNNLFLHHPLSVINQVIYAFLVGLMFSAIQLHVNNVILLGISHGLLNFLFKACKTAEIVGEEFIEPGIVEYFIQAGIFLLLFSPTLIIYWFLLKKMKLPEKPQQD
jgi:uncharacterized protein